MMTGNLIFIRIVRAHKTTAEIGSIIINIKTFTKTVTLTHIRMQGHLHVRPRLKTCRGQQKHTKFFLFTRNESQYRAVFKILYKIRHVHDWHLAKINLHTMDNGSIMLINIHPVGTDAVMRLIQIAGS